MFRRSYYRCEECQVSFCRPNFKDCFQQWHLQLELDNMEKNIENNDHFDKSALFWWNGIAHDDYFRLVGLKVKYL